MLYSDFHSAVSAMTVVQSSLPRNPLATRLSAVHEIGNPPQQPEMHERKPPFMALSLRSRSASATRPRRMSRTARWNASALPLPLLAEASTYLINAERRGAHR